MPNPQREPISHADMIAAVRQTIRYIDKGTVIARGPSLYLTAMISVLAHLERTQWRSRSEIADSTLGLDTEVLGFQPDIGNEAEDEIPSRYGVTTAGHLASGGWEKCTHYQPLFPPSPETPR